MYTHSYDYSMNDTTTENPEERWNKDTNPLLHKKI